MLTGMRLSRLRLNGDVTYVFVHLRNSREVRRTWSLRNLHMPFIASINKPSPFALTQAVIPGIISCQAIHRQNLAKTRVKFLRCCFRAATAIQTRWRTFIATESFTENRRKMVLLQSIIRRWMAETHLQLCKNATTALTACWRRHHSQTTYKKTLAGKHGTDGN